MPMAGLAKRVERLEHQVAPPCRCVALEFTDAAGTPETPTPPLCTHGRPWCAIRQYIGVRSCDV